MKQLLILLSLTLCFGSASGQTQEGINLFCKLDRSNVPDFSSSLFSDWHYPLSSVLFNIQLPDESDFGQVYVLSFFKSKIEWSKFTNPKFERNIIKFNDTEKYENIMAASFAYINRQSLELFSEHSKWDENLEKYLHNYKRTSVCEVVSESKMKQLEKELVDEYNKGNQI